jgi:gliding motility-associated-like protein
MLQWYKDGLPIPGATTNTYAAMQSGTYSVSLNNSCGSFNSDTLTVQVNTIPVITITGTASICEGSSTQLIANGANAYFWMPPAGLNNPNIGNPIASPLNSTVYTVTGTSGSCSAVSQYTITVHPNPVVTVTSTPYECNKGSQLLATGGTDYVWSPLTGLNFANISNPIAMPGSTTNYIVTVTDSNLCSTTSSLTLLVNCDSLEIPTGISPDDNGVNDTWIIRGLEFYPGNRVSIYNRWGNLVFDEQPYRNDWTGNCNKKGRLGGETLVDGTYYFILELGDGLPVKTGYIEIRRK